jgi:CheY-like chemotaxis protein
VGSCILLVDDDPIILALVGDYLRQRGYRVEEAQDGVEALAALKQVVPDVLVTDLAMPRMDGWSLLRALAQTHPDLPAIVLSARESRDEVFRAIREGILFDYLLKPPDLAVVDIAIRRAAGIRELRAKAREADQVAAMRELATTAADRILNPCHIISLTLTLLQQKGFPVEATARAAPTLQAAVERISRVVHQMARVSRYAPCEVVKNLREIDLDRAANDDSGGMEPSLPLEHPPRDSPGPA